MIQFAASSPSSTCHHRRSAGPRNTGVVVPARCAVVQPSPKTKISSPDADRSAIRCSSSLAGSLLSAALLILCSSPASVPSVAGNTAPHRRDSRPGSGQAALSRPAGELVPGGQLELAQHRGHVALHRLDRDIQFPPDLPVGVAPRNQPEHIPLPRGELVKLGVKPRAGLAIWGQGG